MNMNDEYFVDTYYDYDDDLSLFDRDLWGNGDSSRYGNWGSYSHPSRNSTNVNDGDDKPDASVYVRAVLGFMIALLIYFAALVYVCEKDRAVSKRDIDRSIITKRVLPHGSEEQCQSEKVDNSTEEEEKVTEDHMSCLSHLIPPCWRNTKDKVAPEEDILEQYRARSPHVCVHCNSLRMDVEHNGVVADDDDLVLAEEGECIAEEMTCNICLDAFEVGQKVSWSKEGCQHVFHYDCILPWCILGHVRCPVCREVYWSREKSRLCRRRKESESAIEMRKKTFCVVHGLKSPTDTAEDGDDIIQKSNNLSMNKSKSWGCRATPPPVAAFHISDNDNQ